MIFSLFLLVLLLPDIILAEELPVPFWKNEYKKCYETADLVVTGSVTGLDTLDFLDGGNGYGYTKFNLTVDADETVKGTPPGTFQYQVWYEGKKGEMPDIKGENSLFCLYYNEDGSIHDPDGFGRLPINPDLKAYIQSLDGISNP